MIEVMLKKPQVILGIDIDEVIVPFVTPFVNFHNRQYNTTLTKKDFTTFDFAEIIGCSTPEAVRRVHEFYESNDFRDNELLPGVKEAIFNSSQDNKLVVITMRPYQIINKTRELVYERLKGISELFHAYNPHSGENVNSLPKSQIGFNLGISCMADDSLRETTQFSQRGIRAYLVGNYPWNQNGHLPLGVERVLNLAEALEKEKQK